jgi:hypothetical protein
MISQRFIVLAAAASVLAACQSAPREVRTLPAPVRAPTVEGSWTDPNGLVSTFQGGTFNTRTTDGSNAVMASGTYSTDPSGIIQITFYSTLKKTTSRANCQLATADQLNCTSDAGAQFSLRRQSAGGAAPGPAVATSGGTYLGAAPATVVN